MSSKNIKETLKLFEKLRLRYETPKSILHVALDLETTGLGKPSFIRITEVGAVALVQKSMQSEWKKVSEFQRNVDVVSKSSNWGKVGKRAALLGKQPEKKPRLRGSVRPRAQWAALRLSYYCVRK